MKRQLTLFIFLLSICWAGRPITAVDIVNIRYIAQPVIDPSGNYIAYVKITPRGADEKRGGSYREIWVTKVDGTDQRQYTFSPVNSGSPQWTPNGHLSFLSKRKDHNPGTQIYILPFNGGEAKLLTDHKTGVSSYQWSPDGKWIAFTSRDQKSDDQKKAEKEGRDMIVMDQQHIYTRLWVYNVKAATYQKVFKQDLNVASFKWSSDSKTIIFQATDKTGADRDLMDRSIYRVRAPSGNPKKVLETPGKLGDMAISPNSENLAFLGATSYNDPLSQSIYTVPLKGGKANLLTPDFKESFVAVDWVDDNTILGKSYRGTKTVLSTINTKGKSQEGMANQTDVLAPDEILSSVSYHKSSGKLVITASSHGHPNELFAGSLGSNEIKRLTKTNLDMKLIWQIRK